MASYWLLLWLKARLFIRLILYNVQAFLHGKLDNVDISINLPARYPCLFGFVFELLRAIYGLHQAPVKFKQEPLR